MSLQSLKRESYNHQRKASVGAAITLVNLVGELRAEFECATRCAEVLGDRELTDLGDGVRDVIPCFRIATEDLFSNLTKLTQRFSIALVEYTMTRNGGQFVCLWRIECVKATPTPSLNLDDY